MHAASLLLAATLAAASPLNVAVLYFDNNTGDPANDVLRKGLADVVATDLANVPPIQIVERERLEAVLQEQKLQQSKSFDPTTIAKIGKLVGATHTASGALTALKPSVRLTLRLVEVATGKVLVAGSVDGKPDDLFSMEEELVRRFSAALHAKLSGGLASGRTDVPGLLAYSQGLDLADQGDLKGAQSKLAEAVRTAPDFTRAKVVYAAILKRVREAEKRRGSEQASVEAQLEKTIEAWCARSLSQLTTEEERTRYFGYRIARSNLALHRIRKLLEVAEKDEVVFAPPSKRERLAQLEKAFLENGQRLIADLREKRLKGWKMIKEAELEDADAQRSEEVAQGNLAAWDFATVPSVAGAIAGYLVTGESPYRSDIAQFYVRPVPAQRDPSLQKVADELFDLALKELPLTYAPEDRSLFAAQILIPRGDGLVLRGRGEEGIAFFQLFLDSYPKSKEFPVLAARIETALMASDEIELDRKAIRECAPPDGKRLLKYATRLLRAEGGKSAPGLVAQLRACAKKQKAYEPFSFAVPATAALDLGDCATYLGLRAEAKKAGAPLAERRQHCDDP